MPWGRYVLAGLVAAPLIVAAAVVVSAVADDPAGLAVGQRVRLVFNPHASARLPVEQRTTADFGA